VTKRRHTAEQITTKLREAEVLLAEGIGCVDLRFVFGARRAFSSPNQGISRDFPATGQQIEVSLHGRVDTARLGCLNS
jgi:hypothetical protein